MREQVIESAYLHNQYHLATSPNTTLITHTVSFTQHLILQLFLSSSSSSPTITLQHPPFPLRTCPSLVFPTLCYPSLNLNQPHPPSHPTLPMLFTHNQSTLHPFHSNSSHPSLFPSLALPDSANHHSTHFPLIHHSASFTHQQPPLLSPLYLTHHHLRRLPTPDPLHASPIPPPRPSPPAFPSQLIDYLYEPRPGGKGEPAEGLL